MKIDEMHQLYKTLRKTLLVNPSLYFAYVVGRSVLIFLLFKNSELLEKALGEWLPSQEVFDRFASEKDVSEKKTRYVELVTEND